MHHSSETLDWLSTYRFHPVNVWLSFTMVDTLMLLSGFSPAAITAMGAVSTAPILAQLLTSSHSASTASGTGEYGPRPAEPEYAS